jgi:hypothetical protein
VSGAQERAREARQALELAERVAREAAARSQPPVRSICKQPLQLPVHSPPQFDGSPCRPRLARCISGK